ncbi:hypothetical protein RCL1_007577 [Eukaryota sp. TZLM3-RCL]
MQNLVLSLLLSSIVLLVLHRFSLPFFSFSSHSSHPFPSQFTPTVSPKIYLIATDLHLSPSKPKTIQNFEFFLENSLIFNPDKIILLGDLTHSNNKSDWELFDSLGFNFSQKFATQISHVNGNHDLYYKDEYFVPIFDNFAVNFDNFELRFLIFDTIGDSVNPGFDYLPFIGNKQLQKFETFNLNYSDQKALSNDFFNCSSQNFRPIINLYFSHFPLNSVFPRLKFSKNSLNFYFSGHVHRSLIINHFDCKRDIFELITSSLGYHRHFRLLLIDSSGIMSTVVKFTVENFIPNFNFPLVFVTNVQLAHNFVYSFESLQSIKILIFDPFIESNLIVSVSLNSVELYSNRDGDTNLFEFFTSNFEILLEYNNQLEIFVSTVSGNFHLVEEFYVESHRLPNFRAKFCNNFDLFNYILSLEINFLLPAFYVFSFIFLFLVLNFRNPSFLSIILTFVFSIFLQLFGIFCVSGVKYSMVFPLISFSTSELGTGWEKIIPSISPRIPLTFLYCGLANFAYSCTNILFQINKKISKYGVFNSYFYVFFLFFTLVGYVFYFLLFILIFKTISLMGVFSAMFFYLSFVHSVLVGLITCKILNKFF